MPNPRPGRNYTPEEFELEVGRRAVALLREKELDHQLGEIVKRLDTANHLREHMVTNERFDLFEQKLDERLRSFITVEDLGDGDFVVKHRLVLLDQDDQKVLHERLRRDAISSANLLNRGQSDERRLRRREVWALLLTAGVGVVALVLDVWFRLHPRFL